jgi:hypothetical protein
MQRDEGECIGGGGAARPAVNSVRSEAGRGDTGECAVCGERFVLDSDGGIPRHQLPDRSGDDS